MSNQPRWLINEVVCRLIRRAPDYDFRFTMRLRSALPVRQAIVRLVQLENNYDAMDKA